MACAGVFAITFVTEMHTPVALAAARHPQKLRAADLARAASMLERPDDMDGATSGVRARLAGCWCQALCLEPPVRLVPAACHAAAFTCRRHRRLQQEEPIPPQSLHLRCLFGLSAAGQ